LDKFSVGTLVGPLVSSVVWFLPGILVGFSVETSVGSLVSIGILVGFSVGTSVGSLVSIGILVGFSDGASVGLVLLHRPGQVSSIPVDSL